MLFAGFWDIARQVHFTPMHILVRVTGQFGWIIWIAKVMKVKYRIVDPTDGENTTVVTVKMQEYNVLPFYRPQPHMELQV